MNENIKVIVNLFVKKEKRERMLALSAKEGRRADFRRALLHDRRNLDERWLKPLVAAGAHVDTTLQALRAIGASTRAYCISDVLGFDDQEMDLEEALRGVVGRSEDSFIFPMRTQCGYYENHEGEQFILAKP